MNNDYTAELNALTESVTLESSIVDDNDVIEIVNKDVNVPAGAVYAVCCDTNSQLVTFRAKRFVEGIDLSTKIASIKFKNALGQCDRAIPCTISTDDTYITFTWLIDKRVTYGAGTVTFQIEFYDDIDYSWQTKMQTFEVLDTLDVDGNIEPPTPTWVQEVMAEVTRLKNLTVSINTLAHDEVATVDVTSVGPSLHMLFGIPASYTPQRGVDYFTPEDQEVITAFIEGKTAEMEDALIANADAVIEPVLFGVTEKFVFKTIIPDVKYQIFAGETPFTSAPCDMHTATVTAAQGFEGDSISVKFYADDGECISTMCIHVTSMLGAIKLCKLEEA